MATGVEKFAERLESLVGDSSERSFAQQVGISAGGLRALLKGGKPTLDTLVAIAKARNVSLEWLATGEGSPEPGGVKLLVERSALVPAEFADDVVFVKRFDVQASAGSGAIATIDHDGVGVQFMALQASWLRSRNINPDYCQLLTCRGDSMEPTIRDGDTMIIDTSIDRAKDNTIYVLVFDGMVFVKRFHKKMNGAIVLMSDNPLYPPEEVAPADVPNLHIAGRLVWAGRFY